MRRKLFAGAALGLCLVAGGPARAGDFNIPLEAGMLVLNCENSDDISRAMCSHYLLGVWDTLQSLQKLERARARLAGTAPRPAAICINHDMVIDVAKLPGIFTTWAHQHPQSMTYDAAQGATQAFMAAYPCTQVGAR